MARLGLRCQRDSVDTEELRGAADNALEAMSGAASTPHRLRALWLRATADQIEGLWTQFGEGVDEIARVGNPYDRRLARAHRGAALMWGPTPARDALRLMAGLRQEVHDTPRLAASHDMTVAALLAMDGRVEEAERVGSASWTVLIGVDPFAVVWAAFAAALLYVALEDRPMAADRLGNGADVALAHGGESFASSLLSWRANLLAELGVVTDDELARLLDEADRLTSPFDSHSVAYVLVGRAVLALRRSDAALFHEHAATALNIADRSDNFNLRAELRRWLAIAVPSANKPDGPQRRAWLEEARTLADAKGNRPLVQELTRRLDRFSADSPSTPASAPHKALRCPSP